MAMQLWQNKITPAYNSYQGQAQECVFTFAVGPEQADFVNNFFVNQYVNECINAIAQESPGDRLLQMKLYRDASPTFQTNYECHLISTDITGDPLPWAAITLVALALIITWLIVRPIVQAITDLIWGPGGDGGGFPWGILLIAAIVGMVLVIPKLGSKRE